jgi:hypothetical protein
MNIGDGSFKLKPALINMVQQSPFCGKASEDANAHLQHFLEICSPFTIRRVTQDAVRLCRFPFSLLGKVKQWFYSNQGQCQPGRSVSMHFSPSFSHWAKPMPSGTRSLGFNNSWKRPSSRHGNVYKIIFLHPPSRHGAVIHHPNLLS